MLATLTEVYEENRRFYAREVLVNMDHINFAREDPNIFIQIFESGSFKDLDARARFTRLFINRGNMGHEMVVFGTIDEVNKKFNKSSKVLLKD